MQILPGGKRAKIKFKKFRYCPEVVISELKFAENIAPTISGSRCDYSLGDQVEVLFNGQWLPAQVVKIVHPNHVYGINYVDQRESAVPIMPIGKGMALRAAQTSIHRFTPDKMRPRLVNRTTCQEE